MLVLVLTLRFDIRDCFPGNDFSSLLSSLFKSVTSSCFTAPNSYNVIFLVAMSF